MQVELKATRNGAYSAIVSLYESTVGKDIKISLCSKYNPLKEGEDWANSVYDENVENFLVYGIGMGYHIDALIKKIKSNQKLYVIDAQVALWNQIKGYSPISRLLDNSYEILITENLEEIVGLLDRVHKNNSKFIIYEPSIKVIPNHLYKLKNILKLQHVAMINTKDNELIRENYNYNNNLPCENVSIFYNSVTTKPIIIVSGGPSLDYNIDELKKVNDKVFIFSTGRTLKTLIDKGIRVDMFCMIDAKPWMYKQIEGLEDLDIPFVFLNTTSYEAVTRYNGPKYRAYSMDSPKEKEGRIETGGSVATAMVDLAIRFGTKQIIFIGQDLAYTNYVTHCENAMGKQKVTGTHLRQVMSIQGEYIPTTDTLLSYKYWIEQKIRKTPTVDFINSTEMGAFIEGCKHRALKEVLIDIGALQSCE